MAADGNPTEMITSKWTDPEKIALLVSVVNDLGGTPTWAALDLPRGRTLRASQACFGQLKKDAALVPMASGNAIPPTKNRGARGKKAANEGDSSTPKKRGRKPKNAERAAVPRPQGDDDDDEEESPTKEDSPTMEESPTKKVKIENGDDHKEKLGADEKVTSEGAEAGVEVV